MILKSYAKLNLYLSVLNKRKDNYHNIETLFERIDLHDTITLKKLPGKTIKIVSDHPAVPADTSNLCYKSAKLLQDSCGVNYGVEIKIAKRIPVAAGLGGGSSNAACTLIGLNNLWRLRLSEDKLARLGRLIGALNAEAVRKPVAAAADALLSHLALLFVPVGVGVVAHLGLVSQ